MTTYYLANDGDDQGAGVTVAAPWRTLGKLNAELAAGRVHPGDDILFRRGDTFFGVVTQPGSADQDRPWTTFGAYGQGPKPKLTAYKDALASGWIDDGGGVWRIDLNAQSGAYTGNTTSDKTDVGFLKIDGRIFGQKRWTRAALAQPWDFFSDLATGQCYIRSEVNPGDLAEQIRIAPYGPFTTDSGDIFTVMPRTQVLSLDLSGSGGGGIIGSSYWTAHHVRIIDCDIHEMGGASYDGVSQIRGGNGVQAWIGCEDWLIERNRIWQCYDVAITYQGTQGVQILNNTTFRKLHARNNVVWANGQSFEVWSSGANGDGFVACSFTGNLCFDAGSGWGHTVRPDPAGRGCHILVYQMELPTDLLIENNVFFGAATNYVFALEGVPAGLVLRNNAVYLDLSLPIQTSVQPAGQRSETVTDAAAYVSATGNEGGTTWFSNKQEAAAYLATAHPPRLVVSQAATRIATQRRGTSWPEPPDGSSTALPTGTSPYPVRG